MALTRHKITQKTPHAAVLIWNYKYRLGSELALTDPNKIHEVEPTIISTLSVRSISTQKTKSQPTGTFTIQLAPTKNWVQEITTGSWMAILMSQESIVEEDFEKANHKKVKFFGRIESIRVNSVVDAAGARQTSYTLLGKDWGTIFENFIYIDALAQTAGGISNATALNLANIFNEGGKDKSTRAMRTREMIGAILKLWGMPLLLNAKGPADTEHNLIIKPNSTFLLPKPTAEYFEFDKHPKLRGDFASKGREQWRKSLYLDKKGKTNRLRSNKLPPQAQQAPPQNIVDIVKLETGVPYEAPTDTYNSEVFDAAGYINIFELVGQFTVWQAMLSHSNPTLNEMFCDLSFQNTDDCAPMLTLYNRIKPFYIKANLLEFSLNKEGHLGMFGDTSADPDLVKQLVAKFDYLKHIPINTEDVVSFEAGTNWRDKFNFVEIKSAINDKTIMGDATHQSYKINAQLADQNAFQREGFRPFIASTKQFPLDDVKGPKADTKYEWSDGFRALASWKFLLREWYFDIHRLLNGTITFMGQSPYIRVGDNILVNADLLSPSDNHNLLHDHLKDNTHLLLHVESLSHNFSVTNEGARSWTTTVQFVRGLLVNKDGRITAPKNEFSGRFSSVENYIKAEVKKKAGAHGALDDHVKTQGINSNNKANIVKSSSSRDPGVPGEKKKKQ